jgi:hypothetical protein
VLGAAGTFAMGDGTTSEGTVRDEVDTEVTVKVGGGCELAIAGVAAPVAPRVDDTASAGAIDVGATTWCPC